MTSRMSAIFSMLLLFLATFEIHASSVTGPIQALRSVEPANGNPGRTAVMVTGTFTPCSVNSWYAFENRDIGASKFMTSFLLTAYALGKDVTVTGDGVCRTYIDLGDPSTTIEGVRLIELK